MATRPFQLPLRSGEPDVLQLDVKGHHPIHHFGLFIGFEPLHDPCSRYLGSTNVDAGPSCRHQLGPTWIGPSSHEDFERVLATLGEAMHRDTYNNIPCSDVQL